MAKARKFYQGAWYYQETHERSLSMFMLQQATELIFRTVAISLYGHEKRTHSIKSLKKFNRRLAPQMNDLFPDNTPEEERLSKLLEEAYLDTRYNSQYEIHLVDLYTVLNRVFRLFELAESVFEVRMQAMVRATT